MRPSLVQIYAEEIVNSLIHDDITRHICGKLSAQTSETFVLFPRGYSFNLCCFGNLSTIKFAFSN